MNGSSKKRKPPISPRDYHEDPPELDSDQLEMKTVDLYAADLEEGVDANDSRNFTGEYAHL